MKSKGTEGTSLTKVREAILFGRFLRASVVAMAVFVLAFVLVPYIVHEANAAVNLSFDVTWTPTSLTLDPDKDATDAGGSISDLGHGDVLFGTIVPTSKTAGATAATGNVGTLKIIKKTISIESTGQYYSVYMSTNSSSSNSLDYDGDSSFAIPGIPATFTTTTEVEGQPVTTAGTPTVFSNYGWGVAVPGMNTTGIANAPTFASSSYYSGKLNEEMIFKDDETIYKNVTFVQVPVSTAPQQIWKATTNDPEGFGGTSGDTTNNHFDVYYGVMVNSDVLAGTYQNRIVYTALASSASLDNVVSNNILTDKNYGADDGSTPISMELAFDLAESADTSLITSSNVTVYVVKHQDMVTANYDVTRLAAQSRTCAITNFEINSNRAALTCDMPIVNEVADNTADGTTAAGQAGRYDFWVKVMPYNYNFVTMISDGSSNGKKEAFAYVGLQSVYKQYVNNAYEIRNYVTKMQEISHNICENTNMWGTTYGSDARIYDRLGEVKVEGVVTATPLANTAADSVVVGLGTFDLIDSRDNKDYLVRRLADGNCWMVQNLDLELETFAGTTNLNNTNTDLKTVTSWDPRAWALAQAEAVAAEEGYTGPEVTTDNYFRVLSLDRLGVEQAAQYQAKSTDGSTYGYTNNWGSRRNPNTKELFDGDSLENTAASGATAVYLPTNRSNTTISPQTGTTAQSTTGRVWVENNSLSVIPRSYDNGLAYIGGDGTTQTGATNTVDNGDVDALATVDVTRQSTIMNTASGSDNMTMRGTRYVGNYYNWYAATAGTGGYNSTTPQNSICPVGWTLPNNSGDGSWYDLILTKYAYIASAGGSNSAGRQKMQQLPMSIPFTGSYHWITGSLNDRGSGGLFWAATPSSSAVARYLGFSSSYVGPQGNVYKVGGFTVRCVVR